MGEGAALRAGEMSRDGLLLALQRQDRLLERAVRVAPAAYGPEAATDRCRGLYELAASFSWCRRCSSRLKEKATASDESGTMRTMRGTPSQSVAQRCA